MLLLLLCYRSYYRWIYTIREESRQIVKFRGFFVEINTRAVAQKYDLNVMRCSCEKKKKVFVKIGRIKRKVGENSEL